MVVLVVELMVLLVNFVYGSYTCMSVKMYAVALFGVATSEGAQ